MQRMLAREADRAVHLVGDRRAAGRGLAAAQLGYCDVEGGAPRVPRGDRRHRAGSNERRGARRDCFGREDRQRMLDRLERADRSAELDPFARVAHRLRVTPKSTA